MDNIGEVEIGDLDLIHIRVKELQEVIGHCRFLRVLHANSELVRVGRGQIESQIVVVAHRLDELEEVDHIHAENMLGGAIEVLKTVVV